MTTPVLEAVEAAVRYGRFVALDGVSVRIDPAEWVAITGPSGSGKSTLLQLFAAIDQPSSGQILFKGTDLSGMRHLDQYRRHDVGLVFQLHNLLTHLTAARNVEVAMFGTGRSRRSRRARALELLDLVDLADQHDRTPPEMSGGERQRVAIARALANNPTVILADEPTGSLDRDGAINIMEVFGRLHRMEGTSIVMVTHDPLIADAADRIIHIEHGRVDHGYAGQKDSTPRSAI